MMNDQARMTNEERLPPFHWSLVICLSLVIISMKIWFNKLHESRRSVVELTGPEISIGRDADVRRRARQPARFAAACGRAASMATGWSWKTSASIAASSARSRFRRAGRVVRPRRSAANWPYTLRSSRKPPHASRGQKSKSTSAPARRPGAGDSQAASGAPGPGGGRNPGQSLRERVLLLENHIEDICRELGLFHERNEGLLAEIAGVALRDL